MTRRRACCLLMVVPVVLGVLAIREYEQTRPGKSLSDLLRSEHTLALKYDVCIRFVRSSTCEGVVSALEHGELAPDERALLLVAALTQSTCGALRNYMYLLEGPGELVQYARAVLQNSGKGEESQSSRKGVTTD